jgi:AcrR family transcriptional regulator
MSERVDGRTLRYQHRRPELLEAATDYALDHGVTHLAMRPLAEAIGVSHATLLHHFGTRENLIAEILENVRRSTALPPADPDALTALWTHWSSPEGQRQFRLLFETYGQALISPDRHQRMLEHVVTDWLEVIAGYLDGAGCPSGERDALATFILAQVRGLQLDLLTTADRNRVDAAFALLRDTLEQRRAAWSTGTTA